MIHWSVLGVDKAYKDPEEVGGPASVGFDKDIEDVVLVVGESY